MNQALDPLAQALQNPEPTKAIMERTPIAPPDIRQRMDARGRRLRGKVRRHVVPGLDMVALQAKYGMAHAHEAKPHHMTFRVRVGGTPDEWKRRYEQAKMGSLHKWIEWMDKNNWTLIPRLRIQVWPWVYPAMDLLSGMPLSDQREFRAQAYFYMDHPKLRRIVLPPEVINPVEFVS